MCDHLGYVRLLYLFTGVRHGAIPFNDCFLPPALCLFPLGLYSLELGERVERVLLGQDAEDFVDLLEQAAELGRETLVDHRV